MADRIRAGHPSIIAPAHGSSDRPATLRPDLEGARLFRGVSLQWRSTEGSQDKTGEKIAQSHTANDSILGLYRLFRRRILNESRTSSPNCDPKSRARHGLAENDSCQERDMPVGRHEFNE